MDGNDVGRDVRGCSSDIETTDARTGEDDEPARGTHGSKCGAGGGRLRVERHLPKSTVVTSCHGGTACVSSVKIRYKHRLCAKGYDDE